MTVRMLTTAALVAGFAAPALAATELDADGDGLVTMDEIVAALPEVTEETFTLMDMNGDGTLDDEELALARDAGMLPPSEG